MSKKIAVVATTSTLTFRREHPKDRVSYGIPGVAGIAVFDKSLFAGGKAPKTVVVNCELAGPKPEPAKTTAKPEAAPAASGK